MILALILLGMVLGLISATITESVGHKWTGHPSAWQRRLYFKYPKIFLPFLKPLYQHLVIHHHKTFQGEFFDQFKSEEDKLKVDGWIRENFTPEFANLIWKERYNLTLKGGSGTIPFAIPFCVGPAIIAFTLGWPAFLGSLLTAYIPVWLSKYVHPLVHLPEETCNAHPFVQWLMRTKYMQYVFRNHYLHHQEQETNFNLLLGGDYLVGLSRKATPQEEADMARLLVEFNRRIQLRSPAEVLAPAAATVSREEFERDLKNYVSLENPTYEQRHQAQLRRSLGFETARAQGWQDVLSSLQEGETDFDMSLYDKRVKLENWAAREEFALEAYERRGDKILSRGVAFEEGDILLVNQASDSDGLFSTLLEGNVSFAHVALFCVLEFAGRKLPSIVEINEYGVRAVPLKAFSTLGFSTYIEVFERRDSLTAETKAKLADSALQMIREDHAFDIYQDSSQSYYLNCARTVYEIYRRAGIEIAIGNSFYDARTWHNLQVLGIQRSLGQALLMPDDFTRSPDFKIKAVIDNGRFEELLARALIRDRIQEIWRTELLDHAQFPVEYDFNKFVIDQIQRETMPSWLFLRLIKMKRENFPSGPILFLALASTTNKLMEKASRELRAELPTQRRRLLYLESWNAIRDDLQIRALVLDASRGFRELYAPEIKLAAETADVRVKPRAGSQA